MNRFWQYKLDHAIFWLVTIGFHMFTRYELVATAGVEQFALEIVVRNVLLAILIYTNWLVLVPRFARRGSTAAYVVLLGLSIVAYVLLKNAHDVYLNAYVMGDAARQSFFYSTYYNFSIALFYLAFHVALQLSREWYFQREVLRQMQVDKLTSELEYLKAQINPHFVFNSINTIFFQIDKQNVSARETLSAFSEMLRYQLYECNGKEIAIEREVLYLKNYVDLQRMRRDSNYDISFTIDDGVKGFTICPLLLIPFVENAFKHVSHQASNKIEIRMAKRGDNLELYVFNTSDLSTTHDHHTGIGLKNVQRRLELLYKDRHWLTIDNKPEGYTVMLQLQVK